MIHLFFKNILIIFTIQSLLMFQFCSNIKFELIEVSPQQISVEESQDVIFNCIVNDSYRWCAFKHDNLKCDYEWNRYRRMFDYNIDTLECNRDNIVVNQSTFTHCTIQINSVTLEDSGEWSCELEQWQNYRAHASKVIGNMELKVSPKTQTQTLKETTTKINSTSTINAATEFVPLILELN